MPALSIVNFCSTEELKGWLDKKREFTLIDTSISGEYQAEHIPSARNACVFEMTFLDEVRALTGSDPAAFQLNRTPIVVYGTSARSLASATAAEKLVAAGFDNVYDYRGGLHAWREADEPTEGTHTWPSQPVIEDRVYSIDPRESIVKWTGRNLTSEHSGIIKISSGEIIVAGRRVTGGRIILDMDTLENTDIDDASMRALLAGHLKSDDFFDVARFPTAELSISSMDELPEAQPSSPTHRVSGALTVKGVTREIDFLAQVGSTKEGAFIGRADFDIDRTLWNVIYGSGKFFEKLGMHLVSDFVSLDLKIVAR